MKRIFYIFCILALTTAAGFCQDTLLVLPDGTVEVNGRITASEGVENAILPVGTILMYDGSEIADAGMRTEKVGDHPSDTIDFDLYGSWYVCNGKSGAPDLINRFIRGDIKSGNTGGSDDAVLIHHTDSFVDYTSYGEGKNMLSYYSVIFIIRKQ